MRQAPDDCAATVARTLLAWHRDPAHGRVRYLRGEEPMPAGPLVIPMAQGRMPAALAAELDEEGRVRLQEAAAAFLRQVCLAEHASHYQVLCANPHASSAELRDHYRLLMALMHPDRQRESPVPWDAAAAQRVNRAYAVLSDERLRAGYDLHLGRHEAAPRVPGRPFARKVRAAIVMVGALAVLLVVQASFVRELPREYSLLESAFSVGEPRHGARSAVGEAFAIDGAPAPALDTQELLKPLPLPSMVAAVGSFPMLDDAQPVWRATPAVAPRPEPAPPAARPAPEIRLAQLAPSTPQRERPSAALGAALAAEDVEMLVARLVGYYEAGDLDHFMGLFDPDALGYWAGMRVRNAYAAFFRDTRERRLQVHRLTWQIGPGTARASGKATVHAEEAGGARIERPSDLELEIVVRNGQPRIARLALYPEGT